MHRTPSRVRLAALLFPFSCCLGALAQSTSMPVPTPVPANSIPSMPAVETPLPVAPAPVSTTSKPYQDPLEKPLDINAPTRSTSPAAPDAQPSAPLAPPAPHAPNAPLADPSPSISAPIVTTPATRPADIPSAAPRPDLATPIITPTSSPGTPYIPTPNPVSISKVGVTVLPSEPAYLPVVEVEQGPDRLGSTYIPLDSPIYPMALRLYSLGYLGTINIQLRPWTRRSLLHALDETSADIGFQGDEEAQLIFTKLQKLLQAETPGKGFARGRVFGVESVYTRFMGINGTPLRDSYHIGQTLVNDYGRPYAKGFNNITGFTSVNEMGRFSLYVRGEYQHAPAGEAYSSQLAQLLANTEEDTLRPGQIPATIPIGKNVAAQDVFRLQEATVSFHLAGHEISGGKSDAWIGAGYGGGMAWSNNAENIYSFRINRVEPLHIPLLSSVLGTLRYDFFVGSLKGHTHPNAPWVHAETLSFSPTSNFQFGFERTVIWGGREHEAVNLRTFLKSFFDINDTTFQEKFSGDDPGARFTTFNFSWRLPYLRKYVTLYTDSLAHDDVTPVSAPRRAAYRPGIYLSQFPHLPKLDLRVEAASTDTSTLRSNNGQFNYYEGIQVEGYTNKGFIMGDWIGREAKGGQAWLTYHLSPDEWVQLSYLNKKTPKDFITLGTTQNQFKLDVVKHLPWNILADASIQYERWFAPIYRTYRQADTTVAFQFTWFPKLHTVPKSTR